MTPSDQSVALVKWSKPGVIYCAKNKINGKCYVGQTTHTVNVRIGTHKRDSRKGSDCAFHRAIRKYGIENFDIKILCHCVNKIELDFAERLWIKTINSLSPNGYNMTTGGDSPSFTEEGRIKLSKALKGMKRSDEFKRKIGDAHRGIPRSEEVKAKLSAALMGRKYPERSGKNHPHWGKSPSEETRKKLSEASRRNKTPEWKAKVSAALKGRHFSEESIGKMSAVRKKYWETHERREWTAEEKARVSEHFKSMLRTENHKAKISAALKGREAPWVKGKPKSKETRAKMSAASKGRKKSEEQCRKMAETMRAKNLASSGEVLAKLNAGRKAWMERKRQESNRKSGQLALGFEHGGSTLPDAKFPL